MNEKTCLNYCKYAEDKRHETCVCDVICHNAKAIEKVMRDDGTYTELEIITMMKNEDDGLPVFDVKTHNGVECEFYRKQKFQVFEEVYWNGTEQGKTNGKYVVKKIIGPDVSLISNGVHEAEVPNVNICKLYQIPEKRSTIEVRPRRTRTRKPKYMRIPLGTYPIDVAKAMRKRFNEEKKRVRKLKEHSENEEDLLNTTMRLRGRGRRQHNGTYYQSELPLRYAERVAVYLIVN